MAGGALAPTMESSTSGASLLASDIVWHHVCTMVGVGTGQLVILCYRGLSMGHSGSQWYTMTHGGTQRCTVVVHTTT